MACSFQVYYCSLTHFHLPLSLSVFQMAFTASVLSVCCGFSSLQRRCSAAASLCVSRTCPQEHFLSPLLTHFLEGVSAVLQSLLMMCLCSTCSRMQMQERCSTLVSPLRCREGSFFPSEALEEQLYLNRPRLNTLAHMEVKHIDTHSVAS